MIVVDQPERVMHWVAERTGGKLYTEYAAIGLERDGELIAGAVFNHPTHGLIWGHLAGTAATPAFLHACFAFPFDRMKVNLLCGLVRSDNARAIRFDEHLGFSRMGLLPGGGEDGVDLIVMGMRKSECKFLGGKYREAFQLVARGS